MLCGHLACSEAGALPVGVELPDLPNGAWCVAILRLCVGTYMTRPQDTRVAFSLCVGVEVVTAWAAIGAQGSPVLEASGIGGCPTVKTSSINTRVREFPGSEEIYLRAKRLELWGSPLNKVGYSVWRGLKVQLITVYLMKYFVCINSFNFYSLVSTISPHFTDEGTEAKRPWSVKFL